VQACITAVRAHYRVVGRAGRKVGAGNDGKGRGENRGEKGSVRKPR